ncbi:hypothetical protein OEZ86_007571 [Tetradesmus obliquus]|nr:hypothetical protein OEZ86_007571 [Tetradesmus obliquus]
MQVTGLAPDDAAEVLRLAAQQAAPGWRLAGAASAADLLAQEAAPAGAAASNSSSSSSSSSKGRRRISTSCAALDALLGGGGVACGTVTEFFGVPGVGKTQVGMQLVVNVQLPPSLGGLSSQAMYIDTEGSFMTDRLIDMAIAAVQRVQQQQQKPPAAAEQQQQQQQQQQPPCSVESLLSGILHFRVQHHMQQLALVRSLDLLLQQHPQVSLVVLDSATFHFRQAFPDAGQRARLMTAMAQQLAALAEQHGVAVVMMNQVVMRIADSASSIAAAAKSSSGLSSSSAAWLAPALGEGWGQAASCRVALFWEGSQRYALLSKAKDVPLQQQQSWQQQQQQQQQGQQLCVPYSVSASGLC